MGDRLIRVKEQYDVILGQGAGATHDAFYQVYLDFIYFLHSYYIASTSRYEKKLWVQRVIDFVHRHGGRFLQRHFNPNTGHVTYTVLEDDRRYEKCRPALCGKRFTARRTKRPFTIETPDVFHPPPPPARHQQRRHVVQQPYPQHPHIIALQEQRQNVEEEMNDVQHPLVPHDPPLPQEEEPQIVFAAAGNNRPHEQHPGQQYIMPMLTEHRDIEEEERMDFEELVQLDDFTVAAVLLRNQTDVFQFEDLVFTAVDTIPRNNVTFGNNTDEMMWRNDHIDTFSDLDEMGEDNFDIQGMFDDDVDMKVAGFAIVLPPPGLYHEIPRVIGHHDHMFDGLDDMIDDDFDN